MRGTNTLEIHETVQNEREICNKIPYFLSKKNYNDKFKILEIEQNHLKIEGPLMIKTIAP